MVMGLISKNMVGNIVVNGRLAIFTLLFISSLFFSTKVVG